MNSSLRSNPAFQRLLEQNKSGLPTGALSSYAQQCANMIRDNRDQEKRAIADLNNRLARYIEKAQNRILRSDIDLFGKAAQLHGAKVSVYYESERKSLGTLSLEQKTKIQSAEQTIRKLTPEIASIQRSLQDIKTGRGHSKKDRHDQMKKLSNLEAENAYIKRLITDSENDKMVVNNENSVIKSEIRKIQALRDKQRSEGANINKNMSDQIRRVNELITSNEIQIREEIANARRNTTENNSVYFHNELQSALRDVREQFDKDSRIHRNEWESWYQQKIITIKKNSENFTQGQSNAREEIIRIRNQYNDLKKKIIDIESENVKLSKVIEEIHFQSAEAERLFESSLTEREAANQKMRDECTRLSLQLDKLCDNHTNLQQEIAHYKKLIESAEYHTSSSNVLIESSVPVVRLTSYHSHGEALNINRTEPIYSPSYSSNQAETYKSHHKGHVKIRKVERDGTAVVIENTNGVVSQDMANWKLMQYENGSLNSCYIFPIPTFIQPLSTITVTTSKSTNLLNEYVAYSVASFELTRNSKLVLCNELDEEVSWMSHYSYNH
ncbi:unnamed protein product [Caenorhabditis angaria]|uniref:Uncharacterized protein n=1 Tax=Caenorhabditis angaria TaxID=860376 RepID=A0A9P1NB67_9PELO|nr:unnamed protein product [Caenorhabditis angaria]